MQGTMGDFFKNEELCSFLTRLGCLESEEVK